MLLLPGNQMSGFRCQVFRWIAGWRTGVPERNPAIRLDQD